jgi:hypothetical protein
MTYTDHIKAYNARVEREQQLVNQYNQKPVHNRPKALWAATTVSKHTKYKHDVWEAVAGCVIVAVILVASMFLN